MIEYKELTDTLSYDNNKGILIWKKYNSKNKLKKNGDEAGSIWGRYKTITLNGIQYKYHRLVWFYVYEKWPIGVIDHIDGDGLNNRIDNLRDVDMYTNTQNTKKANSKNKSSSNIPGVSMFKNRWIVRIRVDGRSKQFGSFKTQQEAENECIRVRRIHYKGNTL